MNQVRRAAVSIPSNIAEGYERSRADCARMLLIAAGSAAELRTQAYIAKEIGLVTGDEMSHVVGQSRQCSRMISGLRKSRLSEVEDSQ